MPRPSDGRAQPATTAAPRYKVRPAGSHPGRRSPFEAELGAHSAQIIPICVISAGSDEIGETVPNGGSASVIHGRCCPAGGRPASPRERAIPRANVDRFQATPSYARRLLRLVKCPLSDTEPRPAMPGR